MLARAGCGSRRLCEELISDGRVTVNGRIAVLGDRTDPAVDDIRLDGDILPVRPDAVYFLLHKPRGVVSTASDTHGRATVVDLVPHDTRLFPVGRLDMDSEGLMILTNDGEFAQTLTHPSHGVEKEYLVEVEGPESGVDRRVLSKLRSGVELDDGLTLPARVSQPQPGILVFVLREGRNRQIRRMCEAIGHPVRRLVRVRIGAVSDRRLAPGEWRPLSVGEVRALYSDSSRA